MKTTLTLLGLSLFRISTFAQETSSTNTATESQSTPAPSTETTNSPNPEVGETENAEAQPDVATSDIKPDTSKTDSSLKALSDEIERIKKLIDTSSTQSSTVAHLSIKQPKVSTVRQATESETNYAYKGCQCIEIGEVYIDSFTYRIEDGVFKRLVVYTREVVTGDDT